jgi:hypothetical protein
MREADTWWQALRSIWIEAIFSLFAIDDAAFVQRTVSIGQIHGSGTYHPGN